MNKSILLLLLLTGCGKELIVEKEFVPFVQHWETVYNTTVTTNITFADIPATTIGICHGDGTITVDRTFWSTASDLTKEELIFHELGHCEFALNHDDDDVEFEDKQKGPKSIMYPYIFGHRAIYKNNRHYYYKELKEKKMVHK